MKTLALTIILAAASPAALAQEPRKTTEQLQRDAARQLERSRLLDAPTPKSEAEARKQLAYVLEQRRETASEVCKGYADRAACKRIAFYAATLSTGVSWHYLAYTLGEPLNEMILPKPGDLD